MEENITMSQRGIYKLNENLLEIRFWKKSKLIDIQRIKNSESRSLKF